MDGKNGNRMIFKNGKFMIFILSHNNKWYYSRQEPYH